MNSSDDIFVIPIIWLAHAENVVGMSLERSHELAIGDLEHLHEPISGTAGQLLIIG